MAAMKDQIGGAWASITRPFDRLRERVGGVLEGMSPRDRMLLYGLVIFFTVAVMGLGTMAMKSRISRLEGTLDTRKSQLLMVREMAADYEDGIEQLEDAEQKLRAHQGTTLSAFLEQSADKIQIRDSLKQVKERSTTTLDSLEEKQFTAQLRPISLEQLVGFLYEVESTGYPLLIRTLTAKSITQSGVKVLDVTLDISAFKLLDEQEEEEG